MPTIQNVATVEIDRKPVTDGQATGGIEQALGRDAFVKLLVAQLEQQDPLNPQSDAEFVAQLATFSSLEQLISLNQRVDTMIAGQTDLMLAQGQMLENQALDLVGRDLLVATDGTLLLTENGAEPVVFELPEDHASAWLEILDPASGEVVRTVALDGDAVAGRHKIIWDGRDEGGDLLDPGTWGFRVVATDGAGRQVTIPGLVRVHSEGIHYGPDGQRLFAGARQITFPEIVEILGG
ncbi:MAG: flagellar hook assembly protein FlgD [Acidobacteriota bacterium]